MKKVHTNRIGTYFAPGPFSEAELAGIDIDYVEAMRLCGHDCRELRDIQQVALWKLESSPLATPAAGECHPARPESRPGQVRLCNRPWAWLSWLLAAGAVLVGLVLLVCCFVPWWLFLDEDFE